MPLWLLMACQLIPVLIGLWLASATQALPRKQKGHSEAFKLKMGRFQHQGTGNPDQMLFHRERESSCSQAHLQPDPSLYGGRLVLPLAQPEQPAS
jgi:hypothetical protein